MQTHIFEAELWMIQGTGKFGIRGQGNLGQRL